LERILGKVEKNISMIFIDEMKLKFTQQK